MSEATMSEAHAPEPTLNEMPEADAAKLRELGAKLDQANIKRIGSYHFAMGMGALTLWGAAEAWAQVTGWTIAQAATVANAVIAATIVSSIIHEWGHYAGAGMSDSIAPVLNEPKNHFFMFDFKMDQNDVHQFTWMSWGGILSPWGLVILTAFFVPLSLTSGAALFATFVSKAVGASVFEVPIVRNAAKSGDPSAELTKAVKAGTLGRAGKISKGVGLAVFAVLWLAI